MHTRKNVYSLVYLFCEARLKNYGPGIRKRTIDTNRYARTCHLCELQNQSADRGNNGPSLRQKATVHSIAAEAGQQIGLGDFDLLVGDEIVRLKHVASDPEWLVLSSDASAVCAVHAHFV
jgi:hypothetical protein